MFEPRPDWSRLFCACQERPNQLKSSSVRYRIEIKDEAREQLRALSKELRQNIGRRLDALQTDLTGDVKKLAARTDEYRLRVGGFRVLFMLDGDRIIV